MRIVLAGIWDAAMIEYDPELRAIEAIKTIDDAIDYLMSRGLPRETADALVRAGIFLAFLESIEYSAPTAPIRSH